METIRRVKIKNLPTKAKGIHKIKKVKLVRSYGSETVQGKNCFYNFDYAVVLLDNGIDFNLFQSKSVQSSYTNYFYCFTEDEALVFMSEGETLNFE